MPEPQRQASLVFRYHSLTKNSDIQSTVKDHRYHKNNGETKILFTRLSQLATRSTEGLLLF